MRKTYVLEELDCANCAAKMENSVSKVKGANEVSINFMAMKMNIDIEDDIFDEVMEEVLKRMKKVEKDIIVKER